MQETAYSLENFKINIFQIITRENLLENPIKLWKSLYLSVQFLLPADEAENTSTFIAAVYLFLI